MLSEYPRVQVWVCVSILRGLPVSKTLRKTDKVHAAKLHGQMGV